MTEAGIIKRLIMPENGLNRGLNYENKLVGDCPEMNALDANLNKDIHDAVCRHVSMTRRLLDNDPRKFSMMTQKKGAHAYLRLWDPALQDTNVEHGVPSSTHIIEDVVRIHNETYMRIHMARGVAHSLRKCNLICFTCYLRLALRVTFAFFC
mmetsp:Transcript_28139/g.41539  ORF Transcript_28139/g.41539 Transcript_28139/m.41539 type:complete len:152 (-) Transcript_28139:13-468(-)